MVDGVVVALGWDLGKGFFLAVRVFERVWGGLVCFEEDEMADE